MSDHESLTASERQALLFRVRKAIYALTQSGSSTLISPKKHGAWHYYETDKIVVARDTWAANSSVSVKSLGRVYSCHLGYVENFNPGAWVDYLLALAVPFIEREEARKAEREFEAKAKQKASFAPVDDSELFSEKE